MEIQIGGLKVDAHGEGSRGGKIIGHTSSGKPIYSSARHPSHAGFSSGDHMEAKNLHTRMAGSAPNVVFGTGDPKRHAHHTTQASLHRKAAMKVGVEGAMALQKSRDMSMVRKGAKKRTITGYNT